MSMYSHGRVFDAKADAMIEVGNSVPEAIARDTAAAERDGRPRQIFASRADFDAAVAADEARKQAEAKAVADAEAARLAAEEAEKNKDKK